MRILSRRRGGRNWLVRCIGLGLIQNLTYRISPPTVYVHPDRNPNVENSPSGEVSPLRNPSFIAGYRA